MPVIFVPSSTRRLPHSKIQVFKICVIFLLVLKSDNANGLFEFNSGQSLSRTVSETVGNITFDVQRTLGSEGEVTIEWVVYTDNGTRATEDFVHASGSLVFGNVQKQNVGIL